MADQVNIIVINQSGQLQAFEIFNDLPASTGGVGTVYMNVWGTASDVNSGGGRATFQLTEQFYAVCGSAPAPLAQGLVVSTSNYETAALSTSTTPGSNWNVYIPPGQTAPVFGNTDGANSTTAGGFTINTLGDTPWNPSDYPNRYCGVGRDNPVVGQTGVVPVAVFAPNPNQTYNITPNRTYYIAYGSTLSGLQAAVSDLGQPVKIDFTGRSETTCTVTLSEDYAWSDPAFTP